ncbi:MAG TPA: hypothetical protein VE397_08465 [Stellaceae bacterium]|jgi:hypothetical protein|nr:hypothetical protein [Stellaceae bacterium]
MRIYTVIHGEQPVAVVRAADPADAIDTALELIPKEVHREALDAREPNDAEMVGWLERREDYVMEAA